MGAHAQSPCMALCSCNLFEDWVFHWVAGCRALDPWQQSSSICAWPETRWLCMCDHHPAPPFLPLTPTYRASASGPAHQVLPLVSLAAAQVLLLLREQKLPQSNLTFTGTKGRPLFNQECSDINREQARGRPADREQHAIPQLRCYLYSMRLFPFVQKYLIVEV